MEKELVSSVEKKNILLILFVFYIAFLLLTPLGRFSEVISPTAHVAYYSLIQMDAADDRGYYAYLRSAFFDGDIDFFDEREFYYSNHVSVTGYSHNHWAVGSALLWFPWFLIGHLFAQIYVFLGYKCTLDGLSPPYLIFTALGGMTYVVMGILLAYRMLRRFFSSQASLFAALTVFLSTPVTYYTFIQPKTSHSGEFFLTIVFIYFWLVWRENKTPMFSGVFGFIGGIVFSIRNNGFTIFLVPFVDFLWDLLSKKENSPKTPWKSVFWGFGLALFFSVLPQLLAWTVIFGKPLPPGHLYGNLFQNYLNPLIQIPSLINLVFSKDWGLLYAQPIWIPALIGSIIFARQYPRIGVCLIAGNLSSVMLTTAYNAVFGHQFSFGYRLLTSSNVFLFFGVACFYDFLKARWPKFILIFGALCVSINYFLIIHFRVIFDYGQPDFSLMAIANIPDILLNSPGKLFRALTYFDLLPIGMPLFNDYRGWFFMVLCPILMGMFCIVASIPFFLPSWEKLKTRRGQIFLLGLFVVCFAFIDFCSLRMVKPKTLQDKAKRLWIGTANFMHKRDFDKAKMNYATGLKMNLPREIAHDLGKFIISRATADYLGFDRKSIKSISAKVNAFVEVFLFVQGFKSILVLSQGTPFAFASFCVGLDKIGVFGECWDLTFAWHVNKADKMEVLFFSFLKRTFTLKVSKLN